MKSDVRFEDTGVSDKALIVVSGWPDPNGLVSSVSNLADRHSFAKCDFVFTIDPLSCSGPVVGDSVMKYAESYAEKIKELATGFFIDVLSWQVVYGKSSKSTIDSIAENRNCGCIVLDRGLVKKSKRFIGAFTKKLFRFLGCEKNENRPIYILSE